MMQAIRSTCPGGHVGYVGVSHNVSLPGGAAVLLTRASARRARPGRFLPELMELIWNREINPGRVFDLELPPQQAAAGYQAMDERQAIKVLLHP
jgi:threonine dehydrogenase-like Zn-dependent dehydrogenase